jgi:hypothetical protein
MSGRHVRGAARTTRPAAARPPAPRSPGDDGFGPAVFREEALISHAGGGQDGDVEIHLGQHWLRWLYRLSLGLAAAGIALALTASTSPESDGTAAVTEPGGDFAALLPVAAIPDVARVREVTVKLPAPGSQVRVRVTRMRLASPELARQAGLPPPAEPSILLTGRLAPGVVPPPGPGGRRVTPVALVLSSETVGAIVAREFEAVIWIREAGS